MEVSALCLRLVMAEMVLLATQVQRSFAHRNVSGSVLLRVRPDRLQHFEYESVSFLCETTDGSTELKGLRKATEELNPACEWTSTGSSCKIPQLYEADSGEYWCETEDGERSSSVNVTVTGGSVILELPALVYEGDDVTLRCTSKTPSTNEAAFYKDGVTVATSPAGEMRINNASQSDEGLYSCSVSGAGRSPGSWLVLRELLPPASQESSLSLILVCVSVTITLLLLLLLLLWLKAGFPPIRDHRAFLLFREFFSSWTQTAASESAEEQRADGEDEANDSRVIYATVAKTQSENEGENEASRPSTCLYSTISNIREAETGFSSSATASRCWGSPEDEG